ncbi:protein DEHYDRATION-INDUCED 19 homolog 5-like isoform X1 [Primulina huaijiensis]|uniref:protein DEHYDRATION-INDUCED 19 homolog 5-like isoform X1 n=1 Tax=Primulina huaijiensis TaxID=1492673 RepID=UPI003CC7562A
MDLDFWDVKGQSATQTSAAIPSSRAKSSGTRGIVEDEGEDGVRAWFPCPFCYMEIEVPLLCVHLQEEHCFDLKNAVCPICAANLGKDPTGHFTVLHAYSIKRRKTTEKSGFWSDISTNIVKDLRELSSHYGTSSLSGSSEPPHDPLLSPFLCTIPLHVDTKDTHKDMISPCVAAAGDSLSSIQSVLDEVYERNYKERRQRAVFIQDLLVSTILQGFLASSLPQKSD